MKRLSHRSLKKPTKGLAPEDGSVAQVKTAATKFALKHAQLSGDKIPAAEKKTAYLPFFRAAFGERATKRKDQLGRKSR